MVRWIMLGYIARRFFDSTDATSTSASMTTYSTLLPLQDDYIVIIRTTLYNL